MSIKSFNFKPPVSRLKIIHSLIIVSSIVGGGTVNDGRVTARSLLFSERCFLDRMHVTFLGCHLVAQFLCYGGQTISVLLEDAQHELALRKGKQRE